MKEFCVLFLSGEQAQVCCFRKNAGHFRLKEYASRPLNQTDPAETCRKLLHQAGYGKDTPLIVSCAMKEGVAAVDVSSGGAAAFFSTVVRVIREREGAATDR